jgi:uncharacterized protein YebE (UPF0316 family)
MPPIDALFAGPWGPLIIFFLRIFDVSLATLRMLLSVRGARLAVPIIGFFEILIWVFAVGTAIMNLHSVWHLIGYAAGFSAGASVGLWLEEKLAFGTATVRVMSRNGGAQLAEALRGRGFGVTEFAGNGRDGRVDVVYTVLRRRHVPHVFQEVQRWDPDAFVLVEEPRSIQRGWLFSTRRK